MKYRQERQQLREENERLATELNRAVELLEKQDKERPDVDSIVKELEDLRAGIREGATRAVWEDEARKLGVNPDHFDDLWTVAPPEIGEDLPDAKALRASLKAALKTRPHVLAGDDQADDDQGDGGEDLEDQGDGGEDLGGEDLDDGPLGELAPVVRQPAGGKTGQAPTKGQGGKPTAPAAGKLTRGPGAGKGGRDTLANDSVAAVVDRDFSETGRSDAFRI